MRLYKMELYKLCHKKIFLIGAVCIIVIMSIFFAMKVSEEYAYVDGVTYEGYRAVQINRQITEEFKGVITDEKVEKIVEKYGFPSKVVYDYGGFRDSNFLNDWVVKYLSDGYLRDWDDYKVATCTYPIADTDLGAAMEKTGEDIVLEYSSGWEVFGDFIQIGLILGSILTIFSISPVFAGEEQSKMLPLLFTAQDGKGKDIIAKMAAAITVSLGIWFGVVMLDFTLCGAVFGLDGGNCMVGTTDIVFLNPARPATMIKVSDFIVITLLYSLLGTLLLCAETICISAGFRSSFHAVVNAALCYMAPFLLWMFMALAGGPWLIRMIIWVYMYASPFYLEMYQVYFDMYSIRPYVEIVAAVLFVYCMIQACRKYRRQQDK